MTETQETQTTETSAAETSAPVEQDQDQFVQVPKDQLGTYGGDFHAALGAAKTGRQLEERGLVELDSYLSAQGWNAKDLLNQLQTTETTEVVSAETTTTQEDPALTKDSILGLFRTELDERDAKSKEESEATSQAQAVQQARAAEDQYVGGVLKDMKIEIPPEGELGAKAFSALSLWDRALLATKKADIASYLSADDTAKALKAQATPSQLAAAKERLMNDLKDSTNEDIATFASGQKNTPSETLGSGAAGAQDGPDMANMSPAEFDQWRQDHPEQFREHVTKAWISNLPEGRRSELLER